MVAYLVAAMVEEMAVRWAVLKEDSFELFLKTVLY